jgi:hypothetical protein
VTVGDCRILVACVRSVPYTSCDRTACVRSRRRQLSWHRCASPVALAFFLTDHTARCVRNVAGTDQILKGTYSPDSRLVEQRGLVSNAVGPSRHVVLRVRPLHNEGEGRKSCIHWRSGRRLVKMRKQCADHDFFRLGCVVPVLPQALHEQRAASACSITRGRRDD